MSDEFYQLLKLLIRLMLVIIVVCIVSMGLARGIGQRIGGEIISFLSFDLNFSDDNGSIYLMDINRKLTWRVAEYTFGISSPAWLHDSELFFFCARGNSFIVDASLEGGFINPMAIHIDRAEWGTTPSPDGTFIVYLQYVDYDMNPQIFVADRSGENARSLTYISAMSMSSAAWSPDSSQITFAAYFADTPSQIYVINQDGTQPTQITNLPINTGTPAWSSDGNRLVFGADDGIYIVEIMTRDIRKITSAGGIGANPVWSSDDTRIIFQSGMNEASEIYMINADGTHLQRLTYNNTLDYSPSWMP